MNLMMDHLIIIKKSGLYINTRTQKPVYLGQLIINYKDDLLILFRFLKGYND